MNWEMQGKVHEKVETLWPYGGFTVRAFERKLGEGKLTLTRQSLLFEAKNGDTLGFDFPTLRLIRLKEVHTVEVAYSIQGELRNASFRIVCTFIDGMERDELPSREDPYRMSLLRAITGGVVARFLADHSNARVEDLTRMSEQKFEERIKDLEGNISLFPDKRQFEDDAWSDEGLRKGSLEAAQLEPLIWDDPDRIRLYYTGTDPTMTVDNAFEKLDLLQEDWVNGRLSPDQRAKSVVIDYRTDMRQFELGYLGARGEPSKIWKDNAERLLQFEKCIGVDVLKYL
jgi:hypothetical protein